jgi:peptide-N4-(N-acetyl-beta-glucosaminyl)asparagine amidase
MICFNIFYQDSLQTVIEVGCEQSVFEMKVLITTALDYEFEDVLIYLGGYGFIDSEDYFEMPLFTFGLEEGRVYQLFVYNKNELNRMWRLCCSQKIVGDNPLTQVGYLVEYGSGMNKSKFPVCYACSIYCHNNAVNKEFMLENNFYCLCGLNSEGKNSMTPKCIFEYLKNIESIIENDNKEINNFTFLNVNSLLTFHAEKLYLREKNKIEKLNIDILARTFDFERSVKFGMQRVKMYELKDIQEKVISQIPVDELNKEALENSIISKLDYKDEFIKSLLKWFKKYFSWCDKPVCTTCNIKSSRILETVPPNDEENKWHASRTEIYSCNSCKQTVRFPRYNNPAKLCETKTGRCGEWANLFGCVLRCFNYDTRFIDNFEDHVWNEYYSESLKRWIHVDSCENAWDTPLIYEQGWGRNMTYILAHSIHGVYDVTRRYVKDWNLIASRRKMNDVNTLNIIIEQNRNILREMIDPELIEYLADRDMNENVELLKVKSIEEAELIGRQSGSEEWRKDRGEFK